MTVSYTHLKMEMYQPVKYVMAAPDAPVYVFSIQRRLIDYRDIHKEVGSILICVNEKVLQKAMERISGEVYYLEPVSYTHLDVYKRQEIQQNQDRWSLPQRSGLYGSAFEGSGNCLLYTSNAGLAGTICVLLCR